MVINVSNIQFQIVLHLTITQWIVHSVQMIFIGCKMVFVSKNINYIVLLIPQILQKINVPFASVDSKLMLWDSVN